MHRTLFFFFMTGVLFVPATDPGELRRLHRELTEGLDFDTSRSRSYEPAAGPGIGHSSCVLAQCPSLGRYVKSLRASRRVVPTW